MKSRLSAICLLALTSCALPQSSNELVASAEIRQTYYYPQDAQAVSAKIKGFL
ncbi:MAG: hypothetical protein ACLPXB_06970 [Thiobacillaceae bacterium]